jgi:hypothetical protein
MRPIFWHPHPDDDLQSELSSRIKLRFRIKLNPTLKSNSHKSIDAKTVKLPKTQGLALTWIRKAIRKQQSTVGSKKARILRF